MNILVCNDRPLFPNWGGVERVSCLLATEFIKKGHQVIFFSSCEEPQGINNPDNIKRFYPSERTGDASKTLNNLLKDEKIEVIINQTLDIGMYQLLKSIDSKNIKIITVIHNQPFSKYGKEKLYKKLLSPATIKGRGIKYFTLMFPFIYKRERFRFDCRQLTNFANISDKICLLSNRYITRIQTMMAGFPHDKLIAINNPNTFNDLKSSLEKENLVLFVGRLYDPQKNVTGFIDVWNIFKKKNPQWKAVILGDGPDKEKLVKYCRNTGAIDLEFKGNRKDVYSFYSRAKILCMTSLYEGWPMVLLEAMHNECLPVIFNSYEAAEDIIANGENGFLIEDFNIKNMAKKMGIIAKDENMRKTMGNKAKEKAKQFNATEIAHQWEKRFDEITGRNE